MILLTSVSCPATKPCFMARRFATLRICRRDSSPVLKRQILPAPVMASASWSASVVLPAPGVPVSSIEVEGVMPSSPMAPSNHLMPVLMLRSSSGGTSSSRMFVLRFQAFRPTLRFIFDMCA